VSTQKETAIAMRKTRSEAALSLTLHLIPFEEAVMERPKKEKVV
jgi:hypothetical protein